MKIRISVISLIFIGISYFSLINGMDRHHTQIAAHQEEKLMLFLQQDFTPTNARANIPRFENKLQAFQERIKEREDRLYENIKIEFNISDELWNDINTITELAKTKEQTALHLPLEGVVHDEKMPSYIKQMFIALLEQKGIHPKRVNLSYNAQDPHNGRLSPEQFSFSAYCSHPDWHIKNSQIIVDDISTPGKIEISKMAAVSLSEQEALCTMLVELIAQQLFIRNITLLTCANTGHIQKTVTRSINHHTNSFDKQTILTQNVNFEDSEPFETVDTHRQYIASLHAALLNQESANLMYKYWSRAAVASLDRAAHLYYFTWHAKIKRYWDCVAWLQRYNN